MRRKFVKKIAAFSLIATFVLGQATGVLAHNFSYNGWISSSGGTTTSVDYLNGKMYGQEGGVNRPLKLKVYGRYRVRSQEVQTTTNYGLNTSNVAVKSISATLPFYRTKPDGLSWKALWCYGYYKKAGTWRTDGVFVQEQ